MKIVFELVKDKDYFIDDVTLHLPGNSDITVTHRLDLTRHTGIKLFTTIIDKCCYLSSATLTFLAKTNIFANSKPRNFARIYLNLKPGDYSIFIIRFGRLMFELEFGLENNNG